MKCKPMSSKRKTKTGTSAGRRVHFKIDLESIGEELSEEELNGWIFMPHSGSWRFEAGTASEQQPSNMLKNGAGTGLGEVAG